MQSSTWWRATDEGLVVHVHVVPGARTDEIAGVHGDRLRVRVQAPAVDGRANDALCRFLAKRLGVRRSAVMIARGERSRDKTVLVEGLRAPPDRFGVA